MEHWNIMEANTPPFDTCAKLVVAFPSSFSETPYRPCGTHHKEIHQTQHNPAVQFWGRRPYQDIAKLGTSTEDVGQITSEPMDATDGYRWFVCWLW